VTSPSISIFSSLLKVAITRAAGATADAGRAR